MAIRLPTSTAALADDCDGARALLGSTPLAINGSEGGWIVEQGPVDLFAVPLVNGEPGGARIPLCSFAEDELILSAPQGTGYRIIAVGRVGTVVRRITWSQIAALPLDHRATAVEAWVCRITAAVCGTTPVAQGQAAEPGVPADLVTGQLLYAPRGAVWVIPRTDGLCLAIDIDQPAGAMPIAAGLALKAVEDCRVDCLALNEALAGDSGEAGLAMFHRAIAIGLEARIAHEEEAARQRMATRAAADRLGIETGLRHLAGVAVAKAQRVTPALAGDPLATVFAAVAAQQGIALSRLPQSTSANYAALRSLARANRVGLRGVLLREGWWRRDNGPLIGWVGEAGRPVALLPDRRGAYRVWDPQTGSSPTIDSEIAENIAAQAVMLYRPFPQTIGGHRALAWFAGRGLGRELATIVAMGGLAGVVAALLPLAIGYLFGSAVPRSETGQTLAVIGGLTLAAFGGAVFDLTKATALLRLEGRVESALQPAVMQRMLELPVNFFRTFGAGAGNTLMSLLSALFALTSFVVILLYSLPLALLAAGLVAVAGTISLGLALLELRQERARVVLRGREDGLLVQLLQGIAKLRVAAGEARIFAVWAELFARQRRHLLAAQRWAATSEIFNEVYPILALLILFLVASRLLAPGKTDGWVLDLGGFLAVNAAFGQLLAATTAMARASATALELVPLFERLRPILDTVPEASASKNEAPPLSGRIELSHVSFRYAEGMRLALDDVSLGIEPGAFVAVVGASGSGKSTLLRLLLGFEAAESGDILYDGQSILTLDLGSLRRQIGAVLQHCRITTGSIFHNITSGLPYALDDAWAAARLAGVADDIEAMPMGMHTLLMEGSATLSGGQRQRLMIARALIGRPRILLFDEATSALDNRSQGLVMQSLERLSTTRVVIAHRLSTVERADRIVVFDHGRVVEAGSYADLVAGTGPFSRLARRQSL